MRALKLAFLLFTFSIVIVSRSSSNNKGGTVLYTQVMLDEVAGLAIDTVMAGSFVSATSEFSGDSAWVYVHHDGKSGWLPTWSVALDATAGYILEEADIYPTDGSVYPSGMVPAGAIVGVGASADNKSLIYYIDADGQPYQFQGWVYTDKIGYDLETLLASDGENYGTYVDFGESDTMVIPTNLEGASTDFLAQLAASMHVMPDAEKNQITVAVDRAQIELEEVVNTLILKKADAGDDPGSWAPGPRWQYLAAYVAQIPDFVDIGPHTDYVQYADEQFKTEIQKLRAFLMMRIDRSPENIQRLYDTFGEHLRLLLGSHDVSAEVSGLIKAYDHIISLSSYEGRCKQVLGKLRQWDASRAKNGIIDGGSILSEQRSILSPILAPDVGEFDTDALANYSFWLRRIDEGNYQVVYKILWDIAGIGNEEEGEGLEEVEVVTCKFQDYSVGDCGHLQFDCGDFGDADISKLTEEQKKLWDNLTISDSNGDRANPEYQGKLFMITLGSTTGPACNEGKGGNGVVAMILEFKLATEGDL